MANMQHSLDDDSSNGWSYQDRAGSGYSRYGRRYSSKDRHADGFDSGDLSIVRGKGRSLVQSYDSERVAHARERTNAARREFIAASKEEIRARKELARRRFEEAIDFKESRYRQRDHDDHHFSHYHHSGEKDERKTSFRAVANRTSIATFIEQSDAETKDSDALGNAEIKSGVVDQAGTKYAAEDSAAKRRSAVEMTGDAVGETTEAESIAVEEVDTKSDAVDGTTAELVEGEEIEKRRDSAEENADSASESGEAGLVEEGASGNAGEWKTSGAESNSEAKEGETSDSSSAESASAAEDAEASEESGATAELAAEMAETSAKMDSDVDESVEEGKRSSEEKKAIQEESKDIDTVLRELHDLNASLDEETTTDMNMDMDMLASTVTTTGLEALVEEDESSTITTTDMAASPGPAALQDESTTQWGTTDGWP